MLLLTVSAFSLVIPVLRGIVSARLNLDWIGNNAIISYSVFARRSQMYLKTTFIPHTQ